VSEHRLEVADVFRQHGQEFLRRWGSVLSDQQRKVFRDICACRTALLGEFVQQCDHCLHQVIEYKSCRNRHCPKCHRRARDQWLAERSRELLPVMYSHVIFTLPHELVPLALQNPRVVYGILFRAVAEALLEMAADPKRLGARLAGCGKTAGSDHSRNSTIREGQRGGRDAMFSSIGRQTVLIH
jgi:Transposase zinc-binding domain